MGLSITLVVVVGTIQLNRWRVSRHYETECRQLEQSHEWSRLLVAAQEWHQWDPSNREPLKSGAAAGRALRQPASMAAFLRAWPRESPTDVPYLSILADLQFDPLRQPIEAAETCREMIRLDPKELSARQRLVFYHAVTMQLTSLLEVVRDSARVECDLPEFYIYAFLADGLRLGNALDRLQQWNSTGRKEEPLMVAYAMHSARNLDGSIPSLNEEQARALRRSQAQRADYLRQLREMFPENHEVLAYDLEQAVKSGQVQTVAELLSRANLIADRDHRFWRARGWLLMRTGDAKGAEAALKESISIHPIDWRGRHYLADWYRRRGKLSEAEAVQKLASRGRALESELLAMSDVRTVPASFLERLADFALDCGDHLYSDRLRHHVRIRLSNPVVPTAGQQPLSKPESAHSHQ